MPYSRLAVRKEFTYAVQYILAAQRTMRLSDWHIAVELGCRQDVRADVYVTPDTRNATVRLHPPFWCDTAEHQRWTVAHELVHLHTHDLTNAVDAFRPWVPEVCWDSVVHGFNHAEEVATDQLASLLVELLPAYQPKTEVGVAAKRKRKPVR